MDFPIDKISQLAYLELNADQKKAFENQFREIMSYVDQLQKIPMSDSEANQMGAFHVLTAFYEKLGLDTMQTLRDDETAGECAATIFENKDAVKNAPRTGGLPESLLYEVPSIIER